MPDGVVGPRGRITTIFNTTYTLRDADNRNTLCFDNASPITVRVPLSLQIGWTATIIQQGAGSITLSPDTGVTVNNLAGESGISGQWGSADLVAIASNIFDLLITTSGVITTPVSGADGGTGVSNPGALATLPVGAHTLAALDVEQTWTADQLYDGAGIGFLDAVGPLDAPIRIGPLSASPVPTPDPVFIIGREIVTTSNAHGITDSSSFEGSDPGGSYNSYDARPTIVSVGTDGSSHYAAFQSRPVVDATATVSNVKAFTSHAELNGAADITEFYGLHTLEPDKNSTGVITRYFGARFETISPSIATESWGIYQVGTMTSAYNYFASPVGLGKNRPSAALHFGSARTDDIIVNDESVYTRTTSAQAWFLRPTVVFPAAGTMQYITSRPIFSPAAASSAVLYGLNNSPEIGDATANSNNLTGEISAARIGWGAFGAGYSGTISKMFGAHIVEPGSAGGATITAAAGLAIDNLAIGTSRTLLLLGSTTVPSGIYALYSPTTKNLHAAGQTFLGSSTVAMAIGGVSNQGAQVVGTDGYARETIARFSADTAAPAVFFGKSRGTTTLAGAVAADDVLMQINAVGDDGSTNAEIKITGAQLTAEVDGTVAANQVPTRLVWSTMNSGGTFAERMRLTSAGLLALGAGGASTPAFKSSGSTMQTRLRDDSNDAALTALSISTSSSSFMHITTAALDNGAAAQVGTLTNAPAAGNPTKWIPINDNGTTRYLPAW